MADGSIIIKVDLDDKGLNRSVDGVENKAQKGAFGFKNMAKAALGVATAVGGFKLLTGSMDKAIKRVDTLDNAERVFKNMGFSTKETDKMMTDLVASISGLPTPLDEAVSAVQLMSAATGDLGKSQKVYSGLNNAILGFGGSTADVNNAVLQLSQAFANGKIDAQTWNSMINSQMGPTLKAMSKMMGLTMGELKEGLSDGSISVDDFIANLVELDEKGGGGLKSLQQIAQDATKGISTSIANAKTAVVRGVANMIKEADNLLKKLGFESIASFISRIGSGLEKGINGIAQFMSKAVLEIDKGLKSIGLGGFKEILSQIGNFIKLVFDNIVRLAPMALAMIVPFIQTLKSIYDFIKPILPIVVGIVTAFWTYGKVVPIILAVVGAIKTLWTWLTSTVLIVKAIGILLSLNPLGLIIALLAGLVAGLVVAYHKSDAFKEILSQVWQAIQVGIEWIKQFTQAIVELFKGDTEGGTKLLNKLGLSDEQISKIQTAIDTVINVFNFLVDTVSSLFTTIKDFILSHSDQIINGVVTAFTFVQNIVMTISQSVVDFLMAIFGQFEQFWQTHGENIMTVIRTVWDFIKATVEFLAPYIVTIIKVAWTLLVMIVTMIWNNIKGVVHGALNIILGLVGFFSALFTGDFSAMWDAVKQIFFGAVELLWNLVQLLLWGRLLKGLMSFVGLFRTGFSTMWNFIRNLFTNSVNAVRSVFTNGFNAIARTGSTISNSISKVLQVMWNFIKSLFSSSVNAVRNVFTNGFNIIRSVASTIMNAIRATISAVWNGIRMIFTNTLRAIGSVVDVVFNSIGSVVIRIMKSMASVISRVLSSIAGIFRTGFNNALGVVRGMFGTFQNAGRNIVASIANGIRNAIGLVTDAIGNVTQKIRRFLPFSPAKEGALRDIMDVQIVGSLVPGIKSQGKDAERALSSVTDDLHDTLDFGFMDKFDGLQARINGFKPVVNSSSMQTSTLVNENKALVAILNEQLNEFKKFNDKEFSATIGSREVTQSVNNENGKTNILNKFRNGGTLNV